MNNLISVLMTSYNHDQWIGEAIESVLQQSYSNLELIIVDDGSQDRSVEVIRKYCAGDIRVKFEKLPKNQGAVTALKKCFEMSSGKYIAIISSDDLWEKNKLEVQMKILENEEDIQATFCLPNFIDSNGKILNIVDNEFYKPNQSSSRSELLFNLFKKGNFLCHPSMLIRASCYEKIGFYKPCLRALPDYEMWVRLLFKFPIKVTQDRLIKFRKHDFNESLWNVKNLIRLKAEYSVVLHTFLNNLSNFEDLECLGLNNLRLKIVNNNKLIPFYFAHICLCHDSEEYQAFGMELLYKEMSKDVVYQILSKYEIYNYVELSNDVTNYDFYGVDKRKSKYFFRYKRLVLLLSFSMLINLLLSFIVLK